jgi:hypothetical protein
MGKEKYTSVIDNVLKIHIICKNLIKYKREGIF